MPFFSATFPVSVLIEADSQNTADLVAGMWTVSIKQATHGVELQPVPPHIRAVTFELRGLNAKDITAEFSAYLERKKAEEGPEGATLAKALANFYVGMQAYWDSYEFDKEVEAKRPGASRRPSRVRYVCTGCGAWREAHPAALVTSIITGNQPGSEGQNVVDEARSTELPFMAKHLKECGSTVRAVYPDDKAWDTLGPEKRED